MHDDGPVSTTKEESRLTRSELIAHADQTFSDALDILKAKGQDYALDGDALANFKSVAERTGQTPLQVWAVYFQKHAMSIEAFVRNGKVESEPIESRVHDAINYLLFLVPLATEQKPRPSAPRPPRIDP